MQEADLPNNEASRITALRDLQILDTKPEDRFDRYTDITARAFDMPIALISLVDKSRQWFKSAVGIDIDETPRDISFCAHAILGDDVFEIRNARVDPRFRNNPLVIGPPYVRFYAGAPLKMSNGHRLGTLCVIDRVPRELTDDEKSKLEYLADMVVAEIVRKVDAQPDWSDRVTHTTTGAAFFDSIADERGLSVLLFDIDDVLSSHADGDSDPSPGEIFSQLLHDHFPTARSIAHIGGYHFCVALEADKAFDDVKAINHLCSDAKSLLCFAEGHHLLTPYVGRMLYEPQRYASADDMRVDAEGMFLRHESQPAPHETDIRQFLKKLVWRDTIY